MKRILIVHHNWRGDLIFSTPLIRSIRKGYPDSYIASMTVPRCAPLLSGNKNINEVIVFDQKGRHRGIFGKLSLISELRGKRFDTVFLLHRSLTRTLICLLAGIPERIGYATKKREKFLTTAVAEPKGKVHRVEYMLGIAKAAGIESEDKDYELAVKESDTAYIRDILKQEGVSEDSIKIVLNPGGNWDPKRWPAQRYAALASDLMRRDRVKVIISGADKDIPLAKEIERLMKGVPIILCGRTDLGQLAALMKEADIVIANDSGPMHIAVSQNTRVIALFGPTSPEITGPYGRGRYEVIFKNRDCPVPCYETKCPKNKCMYEIEVAEVLAAVDRAYEGIRSEKNKD